VTRVYASTACVDPQADLWTTLAGAREAGIGRVELGASRIDDRDRLVQRLVGERLEFLVHNYFPPPREPFVLNLASPDREIRQRSLDHVRAAIDLTAAVGAPAYSVHAGFVNDPDGWDGTSFTFPPATAADVAAASSRFRDAVAVALDRAANAEIALLVENNVCTEPLRGKLLLQTSDEFLELLEEIGDARCGVLVDTGHLNVSAHTLGFDPEEFVAQLEPHIGAWHVHDNRGLEDEHLPVDGGSWVMTALRRAASRELPVVVEARFDTFEAMAGHIRWLAGELTGG